LSYSPQRPLVATDATRSGATSISQTKPELCIALMSRTFPCKEQWFKVPSTLKFQTTAFSFVAYLCDSFDPESKQCLLYFL